MNSEPASCRELTIRRAVRATVHFKKSITVKHPPSQPEPVWAADDLTDQKRFSATRFGDLHQSLWSGRGHHAIEAMRIFTELKGDGEVAGGLVVYKIGQDVPGIGRQCGLEQNAVGAV